MIYINIIQSLEYSWESRQFSYFIPWAKQRAVFHNLTFPSLSISKLSELFISVFSFSFFNNLFLKHTLIFYFHFQLTFFCFCFSCYFANIVKFVLTYRSVLTDICHILAVFSGEGISQRLSFFIKMTTYYNSYCTALLRELVQNHLEVPGS